jgi:hypothetical protein
MYRTRIIAIACFSAVLWIASSTCLSAAASDKPTRETSLQEVIVRADQLAETVEGKAYQKATAGYMPALTGALMECAPQVRHIRVSSDFVFVISENGWISRVLSQNATASACVSRALSSVRLPRPPRRIWLIHMSIAVKTS